MLDDAGRSSVSASSTGVAVAEAQGPQRNQAIVVAIIGAVAVVLAAVIPVLISRSDSEPDPAASATASPPSGADSPADQLVETLGGFRRARLVLEDDFSATPDRWPHLDEARRSAEYTSGSYEMSAEAKAEIPALLRPDRAPSTGDVLLQVDGRLSKGNVSHGYGLICKATDEASLYRFNITDDGHYNIIKVQEGVVYPLRGASPSAAISSTAPNQIKVLCVSHSAPPRTELRLWINGTQLPTVVDGSRPLNGDRVGLYARDTSGGGTEWAFDNFRLWELTS